MNKLTLTVIGMTCGHCKTSVEKAAMGVDGVSSASVDLAKNTLSVEFSSTPNSQALVSAIEAQGFDVEQ